MGLLRTVAVAACVAAAFGSAAVRAVESDPLPVPASSPRSQAVIAYNEGVKLLLDRQYGAAQAKFEAALALDERLAEAHNNLAFSLRVQGARNFDRALRHYDRALELKPDLAQAYMYRGVLFAQMGDLGRARGDHERLLALDRKLAAQLEAVIDGSASGYGHAGVAAQFE